MPYVIPLVLNDATATLEALNEHANATDVSTFTMDEALRIANEYAARVGRSPMRGQRFARAVQLLSDEGFARVRGKRLELLTA